MNQIRRMVKDCLPGFAQSWLTELHQGWAETELFLYDMHRFRAHRLKDLRGANLHQLEAKLNFHAHSLEKGLSHANLRLGFGHGALDGLGNGLREYSRQGFPRSRIAYVNALSTIHAYLSTHEAAGYDTSGVHPLLGDFVEEARQCSSTIGGVVEVQRASKSKNHELTFKELVESRRSVREYSDDAVDLERVRDAISLATKSPSVCNRQSARVRVITRVSLVRELLEVQGGLTGYSAPPVLLVVTTETNGFLAPTERNQVFIDGGIFSMGLALSLEYEGVAACLLNAMFTIRQDQVTRKLLDLPSSENLICFIGAGNFREKSYVPKSFRWPGEEITALVE